VVAFFPIAVAVAAVPAVPFGLIVGSIGTWWLAVSATIAGSIVRLSCCKLQDLTTLIQEGYVKTMELAKSPPNQSTK